MPHVILAAPSAPPGVVQLSPQSANSILVIWTLPPLVERNGPITGYTIRYREANKEAFSGRDRTIGSVLFFQLENLKPYTDYNVQVAAVNVNGTGPFSTFQETKTLSARKTAFCIQTHDLCYCHHRRLVLSDYIIMFQHSVFFYSFCTYVCVSRMCYSYNNVIPMFFFSCLVPGIPENLTALNTSTQQIRVTWDPPSSPNGILQGYKLTYMAIKPQGVPGNSTSEINETAEELEGLLEGVTYMITVAAVNDVGVGDTATTEQATTPAS